MVQSENTKPPLSNAEIIQLIDMSARGFEHAEVIVQTRLNNFLLAASILCLSWVTMFASNIHQLLVLVCLPILGAVLSIFWFILGMRQQKFLQLNMDLTCKLENHLDKEYRISQSISQLQNGNTVKKGLKRYQLNMFEKWFRSRNLISWIPAAFFLVFIVFLVISFLKK
jgi:hypothetical protein